MQLAQSEQIVRLAGNADIGESLAQGLAELLHCRADSVLALLGLAFGQRQPAPQQGNIAAQRRIAGKFLDNRRTLLAPIHAQENFRLLDEEAVAIALRQMRIGKSLLVLGQGLWVLRRLDAKIGFNQHRADLVRPGGILRQGFFKRGYGLIRAAAAKKGLAEQVQAGRLSSWGKPSFPRSGKI